MNQEKIGKFIAKLRKQKKLTQEQLAIKKLEKMANALTFAIFCGIIKKVKKI